MALQQSSKERKLDPIDDTTCDFVPPSIAAMSISAHELEFATGSTPTHAGKIVIKSTTILMITLISTTKTLQGYKQKSKESLTIYESKKS